MLVPTALVVIVLLLALVGGIYLAKRGVVDDEPLADVRPDDGRPQAHVEVS